jgi:hypothetical protein
MSAQRKLKQPAAAVNGPTISAAAAPAAKPNLMALSAAVWETTKYVCGKECRRDDVPDGASYPGIELAITAKIAGQVYRQFFTADLTVGHGQDVAQSSLPNTGAIIGHILAQLNEKTREAVLRQLPAIYASNGGELPDVPAEIAEAADGLLSKLRATKSVHRRGAVSAKYSPAAPSLQLVG